jgi:hypothetical protein
MKRNPPFLKGMKRIPAGFLLEGFQIEGMAKGMNSLAKMVGNKYYLEIQ